MGDKEEGETGENEEGEMDEDENDDDDGNDDVNLNEDDLDMEDSGSQDPLESKSQDAASTDPTGEDNGNNPGKTVSQDGATPSSESKSKADKLKIKTTPENADKTNATPETPVSSQSDFFRRQNFSFASSTGSISKDYGTPVLGGEKSARQLPSAEKFQQGVEDHIPYENLPNSVGTFERMRNLFSLIREKTKNVRRKK